MEVVQALYEKTIALQQLLLEGLPTTNDERDSYIEKLNNILEERHTLMKQLSGTYTDEEQALGRKVLQINSKIAPLLQQQLKLIEADLGNFKRKKTGRNKYLKGYQGVSNDGMFLDKKK